MPTNPHLGMATAAAVSDSALATVAAHLHGPQCGHLAIAHVDNSGFVHIGFVTDDGEMTCFAPPSEPNVPRGSLFKVCLESENGTLGLHKRSRACTKTNSNSDGGGSKCYSSSQQFPLLPILESGKCNVASIKTLFGREQPNNVTTVLEHLHHVHEDASASKVRSIRHENHMDMLIRDSDGGTVRLHCHDGKTCKVNGVFTRARSGIDELSPLLSSADWPDLFVIPDQTSVSIIKVNKGLCCKKEVPKIESALFGFESTLKLPYRKEIDPKNKTITVWHGTDHSEARIWLMEACKLLKQANFSCEIISVDGDRVGCTELLIEPVPEDLLILVDSIPDIIEVQINDTLVSVRHTLHATNRALQGFMCALPPTVNCTVLRLDGIPVAQAAIQVTKGLCCKKETPKVEACLLPLCCEEDTLSMGLLSFRVVPKQKRIDIVMLEHHGEDMARTSRAALENSGSFVLQPVQQPALRKSSLSDEMTPAPNGAFRETTQVLESNQVLPVDNSSFNQLMPESTILDGQTGKGGVARSVLSVEGVCCQSEVPSVLSVCDSIPGVITAHVAVISRQVIIEHDVNDLVIAAFVAQKLTEEGFPSKVIETPGSKNSGSTKKQTESVTKPSLLGSMKWYVVLATVLWLVSWLSYVRPPEDMQYLKYLSVAAVALGLPKIAMKAFRSLRRRILDINALMTIAVIGALALQDFHEAASVTVIFSWSDWLEERATRRARQALLTLMELKPEVARTEQGEEIPVETVTVGQVLIVRSGDKIPVDGSLLSGFCDVDESNLTGESRPVTKAKDDMLNAGTLNVSSTWVKMRCTATSENSAVARMIRLVEEASMSRSPTEQIVERVAKYYTPIVVLVALCMATFPWASGNTVGTFWLHTGLTLLVVACPCALIISTPITYVCALAQAASFGMIIKGGKYLEILAMAQIIICDKTGTLTRAEFEVDDTLVLLDGQEPKNDDEEKDDGKTDMSLVDVYRLLGAIEKHATHPIARALQRYSESMILSLAPAGMSSDAKDAQPPAQCLVPTKQKSVLDDVIENVEIIPGQGVKAKLKTGEVAYVVGNEARKELVCASESPSKLKQADDWCEAQYRSGETVSWLMLDGRLLLGIAASDQVRDTAQAAVKRLSTGLKMNVVVLTGDSSGAANALRERVPDLTQIHAGLKPADKVTHVTRLKLSSTGKTKKNVVIMVGDGVNDAPALSAADVGIAMGVGGAAVALETADCALMDNDLTKIPRLISLAKRTRMKIIQNISFALASKAVMLGLTIAGYISLGVAIAVDVGSMLLVTLNGVSLLETRPFQGKRSARYCLPSCCVGQHTHSHAASTTVLASSDTRATVQSAEEASGQHHVHVHTKDDIAMHMSVV